MRFTVDRQGWFHKKQKPSPYRRRQGWVEKPRPMIDPHPHARHKPFPYEGGWQANRPGWEGITWDDPEAATMDAMMQFIDPYERDPDLGAPGRRWNRHELRLKSNEDLQKLWIVLMRERNMLASARHMHRRRGSTMPHMIRIPHVRKSMAAIKAVIGERNVEKFARDKRLGEEKIMSAALADLDLQASQVWPKWIPTENRSLPLAANLTFDIVLRTRDGEPPKARPPPSALKLVLTCEGRTFPSEQRDADGKWQHGAFVVSQLFQREPAPSRPGDINYCCHASLGGDAFDHQHDTKRFLAEDGVQEGVYVLGKPIQAELSATLYDEPIGAGAVQVFLQPSKRFKHKLRMAQINRALSEKLKERYEMEDDPSYNRNPQTEVAATA